MCFFNLYRTEKIFFPFKKLEDFMIMINTISKGITGMLLPYAYLQY